MKKKEAKKKIGGGNKFPKNPKQGEIFYRNDLKILCVYDGDDWYILKSDTGEITIYVNSFAKKSGHGFDANSPVRTPPEAMLKAPSVVDRDIEISISEKEYSGTIKFTKPID